MFTNKQTQHLQKFFVEQVENCQICHGIDPVCKCREAYNFEYKFLKAQIPIEHLPFELDGLTSPVIKDMKKVTETYINNLKANIKDGFGLFLYGGHGTGKTTLGAIVLKEAIRRGFSAYFTTLNDCIKLETSNWSGGEKTEDQYVLQDRINNANILLIDDLGGLEVSTKNTKELVITTFTNLFRQRSNSLLSTIVTSNLSPQEMYDSFGSHVYSTLMQYQKFVDFPSEADFRQTNLSPQRNDAKKVRNNQRRKGTGYQI